MPEAGVTSEPGSGSHLKHGDLCNWTAICPAHAALVILEERPPGSIGAGAEETLIKMEGLPVGEALDSVQLLTSANMSHPPGWGPSL